QPFYNDICIKDQLLFSFIFYIKDVLNIFKCYRMVLRNKAYQVVQFCTQNIQSLLVTHRKYMMVPTGNFQRWKSRFYHIEELIVYSIEYFCFNAFKFIVHFKHSVYVIVVKNLNLKLIFIIPCYYCNNKALFL